MSRLWTIVRAKLSRLLDRFERPDETLDYSYEQQLGLLQEVRSGVAEVATARKRLELTADRLEGQVVKLEGQARAALAAGRDDLARQALERKVGLQTQLVDLDTQVAQLQAQQDALVAQQRALAEKIARFRTEKEVLKARYTAAEAMVQIGEAATGIGTGLADAGRAIMRARDKTETMQARAAALDELVASGALDDALSPGETQLDRELTALASAGRVDAELERLRHELGAPRQAGELPG